MPDGPRWTARTVAWYERANARSDYAARVLEAAARALDGCTSALDVGAGFGALALPLAPAEPGVLVREAAGGDEKFYYRSSTPGSWGAPTASAARAGTPRPWPRSRRSASPRW